MLLTRYMIVYMFLFGSDCARIIVGSVYLKANRSFGLALVAGEGRSVSIVCIVEPDASKIEELVE